PHTVRPAGERVAERRYQDHQLLEPDLVSTSEGKRARQAARRAACSRVLRGKHEGGRDESLTAWFSGFARGAAVARGVRPCATADRYRRGQANVGPVADQAQPDPRLVPEHQPLGNLPRPVEGLVRAAGRRPERAGTVRPLRLAEAGLGGPG